MFKEALISIFSAAGITLLVLVSKRVLALFNLFLKKKQSEAYAADRQALAAAYQAALTVLEGIAETTVSRIEATKAQEVRRAVKNGEAEFIELLGFSEEAYQDIIQQISPAVREALEGCVSNTEVLIRNKIEELLPMVKEKYQVGDVRGKVEGVPEHGTHEEGETDIPAAGSGGIM